MLYNSKLKIKTDAGLEPMVGIKVQVAIATTCPFLNVGGSGTLISRPSFGIEITQENTRSAFLNIQASTIERKLEIARDGLTVNGKGKTGDAIVTRKGKKLMSFRTFNSTYEVVGQPVVVWNAARKLVEVQVRIKWTNISFAEKLTSLMIKGRFQPEEVGVFDPNTGDRVRQYPVMIGSEGIKDLAVAILGMSAEKNGEFVLDCSTGALGAADPKVLETIEAYKATNTEIRTIVRTVSPKWFARYKAKFGHRPDCQFGNDGRTVMWTGPVITGEVVLAVEYSSTCQSVGDTTLLLENLMVIDSIYPEFAQYLWNRPEAKGRRGLIQAMINMADNKVPVGRKPIRIDLGAKPLPLKAEQDDRELLQEFSKLIRLHATRAELAARDNGEELKTDKKGVVLAYQNHAQYVDVDALVRGGTFAEDGEGHSIAGDVTDILRFCADPTSQESFSAKAEGFFRMLKHGLKRRLLDSRAATAKVARTARMEVRKVHTYDTLGEWEIHINPNDPLAKKPEWAHGSTKLLFRTPVLYAGIYQVVHNPEIPIGVFGVDALCWHASNEGDADGDTAAALHVPDRADVKEKDGTVTTHFFAAKAWALWKNAANAYLTDGGYAKIRETK